MRFHEALERTFVSDPGIGIYRLSWGGCADRALGIAQWVAPCLPNNDAPVTPQWMSAPFLFASGPEGRTPWTPSQGDLFADDWETLA